MLDGFSATVEKIYAAATGNVAWEEALIGIESLTGSAGAVIDLIPITNLASAMTLAGSFTREQCAEYARDYQANCPRIRFGLQHAGATQFDYQFISEAEMDKDPVYNWFGKHGLRYHIAGVLAETPSYRAAFSVQRTPGQGHASAVDVDLFNLLKPHVAQAVSLADQIGALRSYQRFSSAMIEALPQAIFALDDQGRLMFANGAGQELLRSADGLVDIDSTLKSALASEQKGLDALIRCAIEPMNSASGGWTRVSRPSGRLPYAVFVSPLFVTADDPMTAEAKVLVVVHDTGARQFVDPAMLTSIYGLTDTESRLAAALAEGHSIESAACLLGVQPATARTHLKSIFSKLGVHRQQDLTRLLAFLSTIRPGT